MDTNYSLERVALNLSALQTSGIDRRVMRTANNLENLYSAQAEQAEMVSKIIGKSMEPLVSHVASLSRSAVMQQHNIWAQRIASSLKPHLEMVEEFSKAAEAIVNNFGDVMARSALISIQRDIPKISFPSFDLPISNAELAQAVAGISAQIQAGLISEEVVADAEEFVPLLPFFNVSDSELADRGADMALHLSSMRVLVYAVAFVLFLSYFDKEIDFQSVVTWLMATWGGRQVVDPAIDIATRDRGH